MWKFKFNIKREVRIALSLLLLVLLIAFSERTQRDLDVQEVHIRMENVSENHFMEEKDVIELMQLNKENLKGATVKQVDLRELEHRIENDHFVKDAEIYSDLKGNLVVKVKLRRPIARIIQQDGPHGYIADDGTTMSVSEKFTSRVTLVSGSYVSKLVKQQNLYETEEGTRLMELLTRIHEDDFWRAQLAQVDVASDGRVTLYPQVSKQYVEFGKIENLETKLHKLKIFYKEILPQRGWNTYERVNLEYEGQIVAE